YVGPFKVLERIGDVAYKLDLPEELSRVHNTFYVSNLKKCHADEPLAVPLDGLHFDDKLHFVEEPVEIVDREVKWHSKDGTISTRPRKAKIQESKARSIKIPCRMKHSYDYLCIIFAWTDSEVVRLLAISSPPASPLSPWSSPPPQIPFPSLPQILSPPSPLPSASRREDRPEVTLPPQKRLGIALGPRYEVGESSSAAARPTRGLRVDYGFVATIDREIMRDPEREVGYEITDSWDEIVETLQGASVSTDTELGGYMREFETRVRQDTDEIYMRLDDEQTERQLLAGRLNMLFRDRRAYAYTRHLMETEARMSIEAWVRVTDASDLVHGKVMSLCTTVLGQMSEIRELQAADRRRQTVILELLRIDHRISTEITELRTAL
nr:putative reverse transcriptase domain-containing protein [Tanacetum cinerariifolium]